MSFDSAHAYTDVPGGSFQAEATQVLGRLRVALASLIESAPQPIHRAADVQRAFGVGSTLSWQIHRVATVTNPLEAGAHIPKPAALERFLTAAHNHGADASLIAESRAALADFEQLVDHHAGDRGSFDSMISMWSVDAGEQIDIKHRRNLHRSHSHLYGMCAHTQFFCGMYHPIEGSDSINQVVIRGYVHLRRLRPGVALPFGQYRVRDESAGGPDHEPLDPLGQERYGGPILTEFSTHPLPTMVTRQLAPGHFATEVVGDSIGNNSAATYVLGDVIHKSGGEAPDTDPSIPAVRSAVRHRVPCEQFMLDCLIHRDLYPQLTSEASLWVSGSQGTPVASAGPWDWQRYATRLPLHHKFELLGSGPEVLHCTDVPRYRAILQYACDRMGWDPRVFRVYRLRVRYPVANTTVVVTLTEP